jgi:anti-anti-sigma regulatory factor/HAMP domain-containing protein
VSLISSFGDLSIRARVLLVLASVALISVGTVSGVAYRLGVTTLTEQALDQLTSVREMKGAQIESYFELIDDQLVTLSEDRMVVTALREFSSAARNLEGELSGGGRTSAEVERGLRLYYQDEFLPRLHSNIPVERPLSDFWPEDVLTQALQDLYISSNPFSVGSKQLLDRGDRATRYDEVHAEYHPLLRSFLERFGYYDVFLVDGATGRIVYSVFKEVDFGTSLLDGPYRESNIAAAYRAAVESGVPSFTRLEDFRPYDPSYSAAASFVSSPVFDGDEALGVLIFQLPVDRINDVMTSSRSWSSMGLGESGEAYLVGPDYRLRTESRFLIEDPDQYIQAIRGAAVDAATIAAIESLGSTVGLQVVRTEGTEQALSGETGTARFADYRGVEVFSSYRPLRIPGLDWVLMSEIDVGEALEAVARLRNRMLGWLAVLGVVLGVLAFWFAGSLTRPIRALSASAAELASGDLETAIDVRRGDEIGELARSFDTMRISLRDLVDRQNRAIEALSTPLIPIQNDVVVMPLVGEFDQERCDHLRESLVEQLHARGARVAILDLTGVPHMTEEVARGLIRVAKSVRLLGARAIISGVQPALALELTDGDVHLEGIEATRSLQDAIDSAVSRS